MSQSLGVQAGPGSANKAGHDTTGTQAPVLHIDHTYYLQAQEVESETQYIVAGQIQVTNSGSPALEDIYVYLHIQGSAQEMFSTPYICDANGNQVPPGPGSIWPAIYFGNLAKGQTSPALTYYWTLRAGFSDPTPDDETFNVTPILIPKFTADYTYLQGFNTDSTMVRVPS